MMRHARIIRESDDHGRRAVLRLVREKSECEFQASSGVAELPLLNSALIRTMLNDLTEMVAVVAENGTILAANQAWMETIACGHESNLSPNDNFISHFSVMAAAGDKAAFAMLRGLADIHSGRRSRFLHTYGGQGRFKGRTFAMNVIAHRAEGKFLLLVTGLETPADSRGRRDYRALLVRYHEAQEQERRRIARELHDSTSQLLVGLQLALIELKTSRASADTRAAIDRCDETVTLLQREIRTLSFIHHPPALESGPVLEGLESMVKGFSQRTGLGVELFVGKIGNIPPATGAVLYRVAQEALANIFRHAQASKVSCYLTQGNGLVHLMINDDGIGFEFRDTDHAAPIGVGLASMQERVGEANGHLEIKRVRQGTSLFVSLPLDGSR